MCRIKLSKKYAFVDNGVCVACGACKKVCPKEAISIYKGCYAVIDKDKCVGCGKCGKECPAGCITRKEREQSEKEMV